MKVLAFIVAVLFVMLVLYLTREAIRRFAHPERYLPRKWEAFHRVEGGTSWVYVGKGMEQVAIGSVSSNADDFDDQLHQLMSDARYRATVLNSEERELLD
jgi:hypothetical protein